MNVLVNEKTIRRNSKIGNYTSLLALGLMLVGVYISFRLSDLQFARENENYVWWMAGTLFVGFILFQIGTYFMNRFGRRPRPDEALNASLKGLTKEYTLFHYLTPVSHLMVGPAGIWIIEPYYQRGRITYQGKRWQQKGGGFLLWYGKVFAQEGLGRPDQEVKTDIDDLSAAFKKALGEDNLPPIEAVLVFTDPRTEVDAADAPYATLKIKELKEFLRRKAKERPLSAEQLKRVLEVLPDEGIE